MPDFKELPDAETTKDVLAFLHRGADGTAGKIAAQLIDELAKRLQDAAHPHAGKCPWNTTE